MSNDNRQNYYVHAECREVVGNTKLPYALKALNL